MHSNTMLCIQFLCCLCFFANLGCISPWPAPFQTKEPQPSQTLLLMWLHACVLLAVWFLNYSLLCNLVDPQDFGNVCSLCLLGDKQQPD